jgi:S1-C subfamily serine protease
MEELTKTQIVLLTLLVSFVTSIATGIVTVALMDDQNTGGVTQTVNRVVERTVERVVTDSKGQSAGVVTREVIVKEENLIPESIDKVSPSVVRFKKMVYGVNASSVQTFALGVMLTKDIVVTDSTSFVEGATHNAVLFDGSEVSFRVIKISSGLAYLKISSETKKEISLAKLADSDKSKLGQTVIMISGKDKDLVSIGTIAMIKQDSKGARVGFETSLPETEMYGGPVFNVFGEVVGIRSSSSGSGSITASNLLKASLPEASAE